MRSIEWTVEIAMELLIIVYLQFLKQISQSPGCQTFQLGLLRRTDTRMKADLVGYGTSKIEKLILDLLRKMMSQMKEKRIFNAEAR